jgi:hypothetical protein
MSHLSQIERRHGRDRWKDLLFIAVAVLLAALALGVMTSNVVGDPIEHAWSVTVVDPDTLVQVR